MATAEDPYLLPNGTLRNKLGITDQAKLTKVEADRVAVREAALRGRLPKPPFTFATMRQIHAELFGSVYGWAGEPRTVPLGRPEYDHPASPVQWFAAPQAIEAQAGAVFAQLAARDFLSRTTRAEFAQGATDALAALNSVHAFREGNGRTQRLLVSALARNAGHQVAFDVVSKERMVAVSVAAHKGDPSGLRRMFDEITDPRQVGAMRTAVSLFERSGFEWNDVYVSTTRAGQDYAGTLAGRTATDFMMRAEPRRGEGRILIGDARDLPPDAQRGNRISFRASQFPVPEQAPQAPHALQVLQADPPARNPVLDIAAALHRPAPTAEVPWEPAPTPFQDRLTAFEAKKAAEAARKAAAGPGKDARASPETEQPSAPPKPSGGPGPGF